MPKIPDEWVAGLEERTRAVAQAFLNLQIVRGKPEAEALDEIRGALEFVRSALAERAAAPAASPCGGSY